eukprot:s6629_g1.t1
MDRLRLRGTTSQVSIWVRTASDSSKRVRGRAALNSMTVACAVICARLLTMRELHTQNWHVAQIYLRLSFMVVNGTGVQVSGYDAKDVAGPARCQASRFFESCFSAPDCQKLIKVQGTEDSIST